MRVVGQIARQLLVEGLVLATLAAALGLVFVSWGIELLAALGPSILPRAQEVSIDARVFGFMALAVAAISIGFGLVAARPVSKLDLQDALKNTRPSGGAASAAVEQRSGRRGSLARGVVAGRFRVCLLRVCCACNDTNPGIVADELVSVEIDLSAATYQEAGACVRLLSPTRRGRLNRCRACSL